MKKYYKDFYGCTASITETITGAKLIVRNPYGNLIKKGNYGTFRGSRSAMGRISDSWSERK